MKSFRLDKMSEFKEDNLRNWRDNTHFWLSERLRHVPHVTPLADALFQREATRAGDSFTVVDVGCGSAWVAHSLWRLGIQVRYIGLDFNSSMLEELRKTNFLPGAAFLEADIELGVPEELAGLADLVINAFNFFEIPRLREAFGNSVRLMRGGGGLLVFHIDPLTQLMCLTQDLSEYAQELAAFEEHGMNLGYDKQIDVESGFTTRKYKGILYKISDYHRLAREHGLVLDDFEEFLRCKDGHPQMYQIGLWRKPL